jgi:uncharacterized surface protein with fasciclin (FAS1) repeats
MTHQKLHGTVLSTLALVLATGSLLSSVNAAPNAAPEDKQDTTLPKPETTTTPSIPTTPDTMKKPDAMKKPDGMKKPGMKKPGDAMKKPGDTMKKSTAPAAAKTDSNIVQIVVNSNKKFKTLNAAVKASGLAATLSGEGPFTLFAPDDVAFAKVPKATMAKLLKPENKAALQQVLKNHVLSGTVLSKDIKAGKVTTLAGGELDVKVTGKKVTIGKAKVLKPDNTASNGVIHTIDTVLIPADLKLK